VEEQDEDQKERQSDSAFERYEPPATPEPEVTAPEAVATPTSAEPGRPQEARRSMRSMMFGEEIAPASAPKSEEPERKEASEADAMAAKAEESETGSAETGSAEGEPTWSSEPWLHREEASSSESDVSGATDETASEETTQPLTSESEPALKPFGSYDPWKPAESTETELAPSDTGGWKSEREPEAEPVAEVGAEAEPASAEHAAAPVNGGEAELMAESADGSAGDTQLGDGDRGTLVIIEDDQTAASYYATLFKGNGYHVEVANDGVSGVDLCTRVQPQVILLDVMMPRQNGILVLQTLRASDETKNTPVVVMSNFSEPTLIKRALQLGALEYVIKTQVEGPALLSALPRWMNREKAFAAA
jgi:CheY-like chemotaxis protein